MMMQSLTARPAVVSVKLPGGRRRQLRCNAAAEKEGTVYVGKGKFIVDKKGLAARTGREDNNMAGACKLMS